MKGDVSVIKKDKKTFKDGTVKTHIRVVQGYRPGPGLPPKQRTIKSFGYLEDQEDRDAFMKMVEEFNSGFKEEEVPLRIEVPSNAKMYSESNRKQNYGYKFIESVYNKLDIGGFIKKYKKSHKFNDTYSPEDIFKYLVLTRILSPDSKRTSCQLKHNFYGMSTEFSLQDVYRSFDLYADFEIELQHHLNEKVKELIGRDLSCAFFGITNYFFDIDFFNESGCLRKKDVSKEQHVELIIAMGLLIDSNGLPISMSIFPGNTSETLALGPVTEAIKESSGPRRLVVVADKGINSSDKIDAIVNGGNGFIISQVLKGKCYQEKLFDKIGYVENKDGTYRYKLFTEEYTGNDKDGNKVMRKRKVLLYRSKAQADEGYSCIITGELDYDERKIREVYGGLWRIEQSFRITKSDLYARPVFPTKPEYIRAHFLICYTALLIVRLVQLRMGKEAISAERIAAALRQANCKVKKGGIIELDDVGGKIVFQKKMNKKGEPVETLGYTNEDEIASDYKKIQNAFGTNFYDIYPRQEVFNNFLKSIDKA